MLRRLLPVVVAVVAPAGLHAQLPRSTARALGMLESYTATARGYEAIAWNPALLGMPGRPKFSLNLVQGSAGTWSNAFGLGDVLKYEGDTLSAADKDTILAKIPDDGSLMVGGGADATGLSLTIGGFGVTIAGGASVEARVSRDFAELLLLGNLQRRAVGSPPFVADSSTAAGWGGATAAVAYGFPIRVPVGHLAVGATVKLTQGIVIAGVQDLGSRLQTDPFVGEVRVHLLYATPDSSVSNSINNGFGVGADLGIAYELASGVRLGLAVENVFSSMSWDEDALFYERREYRLEQRGDVYADSVISEIEQSPFDESDPLQAALRDSIVGRASFPTRVRAGAQLKAGPVLLAGDVMVRIKRGLVPGEGRRISAAAELPLSVLAVRGGVASDLETGITFGGGLGFKFGPVRLDTAVNWAPGGDRQGLFLAVGVGIMN